jgi:autotransporter-associated beta strand protein
MTFSNGRFGAGSGFTKDGAGTLILNGDSSGQNGYLGDTEISGGKILANNQFSSTGVGGVFVNNGGELAGSGRIEGTTTVRAGGKLSVGAATNALGQFHLNDLVMEEDGVLQIKIKSRLPGADLLQLDSTLDLDPDSISNPDHDETNAELRITDLDPGQFRNDTLPIIQYSNGGWLGGYFKVRVNATDFKIIQNYEAGVSTIEDAFFVGGNGYWIDYDSDGFHVQLVAVPEPGALASLIGGMGMLVGLQRFRRRAAAR